jgi:hypothetical protein
MTDKSSKQQLTDLLKTYLDNISRTSSDDELELEVKFGTKGVKRISRIDYENVIKILISNGFSIGPETNILRIFSEYVDTKTGETKMSNVRTEIVGLSRISDYCKSNNITVNDEIIGNFVQKSYFKSSQGTVYPVNFNDFNFRVALSNERNIKKDAWMAKEIIDKWNDNKKTFRYLCRYTLTHPELPIKVDISIVKESKRRGRNFVAEYQILDADLFNSRENYEIEIEVDNNLVGIGTSYNNSQLLDNIIKKGIKLVLSGLQNTNYPISYDEQNIQLQEYMKILWDKEYKENSRVLPKNFVGPSSYTLQVNNITEINSDANIPNIRNMYTVTDKADGDRKLLFISNIGKIYFINTNMDIQFTGSVTKNEEIFNTIIDGEHILHDKNKEYINLYAAFDIYYLNKKDIRMYPFISIDEEVKQDARLSILVSVIKNMRPVSIIDGSISPVRYENKTFYTGHESPEHIFKGCQTIIQKQRDGIYEYEIDGLIFTPATFGVGSDKIGETTKPNKITWSHSFKWKPPEFNTIDFLVTFKKLSSGDDFIGNIFQDGTDTRAVSQLTQYKTAILRVGFDESKHGYINPCENIINDVLPTVENKDNEDTYKPMQFFPSNPTDYNAGICNILLKTGSSGEKIMVTEENEVIEDNMIVEFRYNKDNKDNWKWEPLRVRYDKTTEFRNGGKNFGNAYHVANSNWHTIHNPITEEMITSGTNIPDELGDDDIYYNKVSGSTNTRGLRDFHNLFVKKLLVTKVSNRGDTLIDLAVGKGGDISKWIYAKLKFVFGIDISRDNIQNRLDGACARYLNYRKKFKVMPKALFVNGNSSVNIRNTEGILNEKDKQITRAVFGYGAKDIKELGKGVYNQYGVGEKGFNITSIQFAIHYMFESQLTLQNFLQNVSETTKEGGYFIGTSYDGNLIFNMLRTKKQGESEVIMEDDNKIWEVTKQYDHDKFEDNGSSLGYAIDVYQESINKTFREYLVNYDYLTRLLENYGFVLLTSDEVKEKNLPSSTGLFNELFTSMNSEIRRNKKAANEYGSAPDMSANERKISFLNRYFIYKKVRNVDAETIARNLMGKTLDDELDEEEQTRLAQESAKLALKQIKPKKAPKKLTRKLKLVEKTPSPGN